MFCAIFNFQTRSRAFLFKNNFPFDLLTLLDNCVTFFLCLIASRSNSVCKTFYCIPAYLNSFSFCYTLDVLCTYRVFPVRIFSQDISNNIIRAAFSKSLFNSCHKTFLPIFYIFFHQFLFSTVPL